MISETDKTISAKYPNLLRFFQRRWLFTSVVILTVFAGWWFTILVGDSFDQYKRDELQRMVWIGAAGINENLIKSFTGTFEDYKNPDWLALRKRYLAMVQADSNIRWIYLMNKRDSVIFFHLDTPEPENAFPGEEYLDAPPELYEVFTDQKARTVGTYTDKWGTFISAFHPVIDPDTKTMAAVMGFDIQVSEWERMIYRQQAAPVLITLLVILLECVLFVYIRRRHQHEEKLRAAYEQLEKINTIVITINTEIQSAELLDTILEQTKIIRGVDRCAALIWERDSGLFTFNACYGCNLSDLKPIRLTLNEIEDRYLKNSEAIDQDIYVAKSVSGRDFEDKFIHLGIPKSMLIMLIRINTKIKGLLVFDNIQNENAFEERDILLLKNLREHIRTAYIRTQMMEELKYLNEKKNEFLGIAAHDLRNPLAAIMGYVDLILYDMKSGLFNTEDHQKDLETISDVTKQMSQLITNLLDISAIESGKVRLDLHQENLQAIIDECAKLYRVRAHQKDIRLVVRNDNPLPSVLVDRTRTMEVVDNLLSNAIKYTNPGGEVQLYSAFVGDQITTYIKDTGQGLDDNDLKSIFKSYSKLSAKPTAGETSTGLGLAIVKKIVELHGGSVWVESKKNVGSTFCFALPAVFEG